MTGLSILVVGFLLGVKHATEADHLAAVAALATGQKSLAQTIKQGVAWGVGHSLTLMLFGGVVLWLGKAIPPRLDRSLELAVGVMLVVLGVDVLRHLLSQRIHFHLHSHGAGEKHVHAHSHAGEGTHRYSRHRHQHHEKPPLRAMAIGMVHGMAGSAALILLSLEAVQSFPLGMAYIALFGAGSIAGMALMSAVIAVPLRFSARYVDWLNRGMTTMVGTFSVTLGMFMVYQIGIVEHLFF